MGALSANSGCSREFMFSKCLNEGVKSCLTVVCLLTRRDIGLYDMESGHTAQLVVGLPSALVDLGSIPTPSLNVMNIDLCLGVMRTYKKV